MAKKYWRQRCGQCGRSYNKAQWRRNDFWCPECKKFVCYDCVTRGLICPACGSEVKRKVKSLLYNGFAIGVAFMFPSSLMLVVSRPGSEIFWIAVIFISISGILFILGGISFGIVRNRTKRHNAFVARLPKGMIPFNQRAGYGNPVVYVKWKEANLERSPRRSILMRGAYPDFKWTGLSGDWDYPIVSRE